MIESADSPLHRVWLVMLYATGLRRQELVQLKVTDIDSARMLIHVPQGKGNEDRDIMLSPRLLEELRQYWRSTNFKPKTYLFPGGGRAHATDVPMSAKSVFHAVKHAAQCAGLKKHGIVGIEPSCLLTLRDEYPEIRLLLEAEIARIVDAGLVPYTRLHLRRGAGAYICGE